MNLAATFAFLRTPILETIAIACGALPIAIVLGAPAALLIASGSPLGRTVRLLAALVRAIPELVLAIVFVVAIGFGPISGMLALGISSAATVARLFAELLESVRREPEEALRASGATSAASFLVGLLPAAWPGLVGFGAYVFESIMRAAVIVGVVGAGGLGAAMITALNLIDYASFAWYVAALVVLVVAVELGSDALRSRAPVWATLAVFAAISLVGIAAFVTTGISTGDLARAPEHVSTYLARAWPPAFDRRLLGRAGWGVLETLGVAIVGTVAGAILAVPLALALARVVASGYARGSGYRPWSFAPVAAARVVAVVTRAIPPVALALVAVTYVGLGPRAGALALTIHTAGVLGKLFAESLELAELEPAQALLACGSTAFAALGTAIVPGALPAMASHLLYRFEWNVRASTTLGIVGAGGLGQEIFNAQQLFHDRELSSYVLVAAALVYLADTAAGAFGRRLRLRTMQR